MRTDKDVIVALDFPDAVKTFEFLKKFESSSRKPFVKIGMELFYSEGPEIVKKIKEHGHKIFLDLKLHDIPNTVRGGMKSLRSLGVDMVNLHAAGGIDMMKAAVEGLSGGETKPLLIAVTQLTSISQEKMNNELLISGSVDEVVAHYAKNAKAAGLDGVVCSPLEAQKIHAEIGKDFYTVTPGIRFSENDTGDQARVTDPLKARELGSDYIVIGRPVTQAENPVSVYERCVKEFCEGVK